MKIENVRVIDLIPYEHNTKIHDKQQIDNVAESIRRFGFVQPVVVDDYNVIVIGHARTLARKKLGMKEVPCVRVSDLTDEEIRLLRIADNKTNESPWAFDELKLELEGLDLGGFSFDFEIPEDMDFVETKDDDFDEDAPVESRCALGDIWQLGRHRLMCGDSTERETYKILLGGEVADLLLTDPPYNVALGMGESVDEARERRRRTDGLVLMNDKQGGDEFYEFLLKFYTAAFDNIKAGSSYYIWHAGVEGLNFMRALSDAGVTLRQTLIWNKNTITPGRQDFQWKHEPCLYGWKDGAPHSWYSDRSQATVMDFKKPSRSDLHPTMKPVELFAYLIQCSSKKGDLVLDPFGGSGSTLIACEQMDRSCYTIELDEKYCDVIVNRYIELKGSAEDVSVMRDGAELKYEDVHSV